MKKTFQFTVIITGIGENRADAWNDADIGENMYESYQEICTECHEDINECTCKKKDSGDALSESWFSKADDKTERENK